MAKLIQSIERDPETPGRKTDTSWKPLEEFLQQLGLTPFGQVVGIETRLIAGEVQIVLKVDE